MSDSAKPPKTLVIACGALAREFLAVRAANGWTHLDIACLPAIWHNYPERIPEGVRAKIHANRNIYDTILCLYGDCGTGGLLDAMLAEEGVERIGGDHCYAFFAGIETFNGFQDEELGSFYLTDFLVRHFDRFVIKGLGLDRHPQLLPVYFGNYRRVVYLAQAPNERLEREAVAAATRLNLPLVTRYTGLQGIAGFLGAGTASANAA